jgi:hypothetical protein
MSVSRYQKINSLYGITLGSDKNRWFLVYRYSLNGDKYCILHKSNNKIYLGRFLTHKLLFDPWDLTRY